MKKNCFFILLLFSVNIWGQTPGGVMDISTWIKGDLNNKYVPFPDRNFNTTTDKIYSNAWLLNDNPIHNIYLPAAGAEILCYSKTSMYQNISYYLVKKNEHETH